MRPAHVLSPNKSNSGHPDLVVAFDVETRPSTCDQSYGSRPCPACVRVNNLEPTEEDQIQVLTLGRAVFTSLKGGPKAPADDSMEFIQPEQFYDWLESKCQRKRILWCVNHNIGFDLMATAFETHLTARGWSVKSMILPDPSGPLTMIWKKDGYTIRFANLANWWGQRPLKSIGETIGEYKGEVDPTDPCYRHAMEGSPTWDTLSTYCDQDCRVVVHALHVWSTFCRSHNMGTFALTQAGQSLNAFRHRFMDHNIHLHNNRKALELERAAYLGARTECFRIGTFTDGPYHVYDVNSLYPYVMSSHEYPCKLLGRLEQPQLGSTPQERLHELSVLLTRPATTLVCRVSVQVTSEHQRIVPLRHQDRLLYPTGTFTALLTTREAAKAYTRGCLTEVHEICIYESAPLFHTYVRILYDLRQEYKTAGNLVFAEIVKVFMNSLYGKFGQYSYLWDNTDAHFDTPGIHTILDTHTGTLHTYRHLGGTTQHRSTTRVESFHSFPAIAAHITADARLHISLLRESAGIHNVYYGDTDSLFVTTEGARKLEISNHIHPHELGKLKLEKTADSMTIRTLKDYDFGTISKRKGLRRNAIRTDTNKFTQTQFRGFAGAFRQSDINTARIGKTEKTYTGQYNKGTTGPDGWVEPIVLTI